MILSTVLHSHVQNLWREWITSAYFCSKIFCSPIFLSSMEVSNCCPATISKTARLIPEYRVDWSSNPLRYLQRRFYKNKIFLKGKIFVFSFFLQKIHWYTDILNTDILKKSLIYYINLIEWNNYYLRVMRKQTTV